MKLNSKKKLFNACFSGSQPYINQRLDPELGRTLRSRLWQDEWPKLPRQLYPDRSETTLAELWRWEYDTICKASPPFSKQMQARFAPAPAEALAPRYLADADERWYALILPRVNRRTQNRFCYARFWWAVDPAAAQQMVAAIMAAWQLVPFDGLKLRLGHRPAFGPEDIHPQSRVQTYVVAGHPVQNHRSPSTLGLDGFRVDYPARVQASWWEPYCALVAEQERLAPGLLDDWTDYRLALQVLEQDMDTSLQAGGGAINLWCEDELVGHISWRPDCYREQLIWRCWHINSVIVKSDYRGQGLGQALHELAIDRMNLLTTPIVAGLITAHNQPSLKTAAKLGRKIVDQYVIIPKIERPG